jgi:hypothetical protein
MLAVVAMRGMSSSTTAILSATIRTALILFGWCVSDSVFSFCFVLLGNRSYIVKNNYPIWRDDRLLLEVEQAVKHFPCCHKYIFGGWLRHSQSKQLEVSRFA